jgi:putative tryptophan/tyrosine transport system substrate-binding protein
VITTIRQLAQGNSKKLRLVVCALCALLFTLCVSTEAQQPKKEARIGYLSAREPGTESSRLEEIRLGLRELGYIEGKNIIIEYRYTQGKADRALELAAQLVRLKVDIIVVAGGDRWIRAAKNASKTIPVVMAGTSGRSFRARAS